jgi:hypothetical protein
MYFFNEYEISNMPGDVRYRCRAGIQKCTPRTLPTLVTVSLDVGGVFLLISALMSF